MRIVIDDTICNNYGIQLDEFLYLLTLYLNKPITPKTIKNVYHKGYIVVEEIDNAGNITKIRPDLHLFKTIGTMLDEAQVEANKKPDDRYISLAERMISLYPTGKKPGTNYMWRDSKNIIAKRLKNLLLKYKVKATDDEIIEATRRYVESFNGDYRYMQLLKYFISKKTAIDGSIEESSQLMSYLENVDGNTNQDWTTKLV